MAERDDLSSASYSWQGQGREPISGAERSADEIRQDIAARRESITDTVDRLSDRFQQTLDWKAYVSDHPLAALGVAAGLGFLTARIFKPRPSAGKRIKDALAYSIEDLAGRFHRQLENVAPNRSGPGLGVALKAAVTGLIARAATDYLQNKVAAGFAGQDGPYPENELEYEPDYGKKRGYERDSELFR
ncbi:MAG: DUF3618 domain-containing protein [Chloracidobacterium sp.]|nr:DUF3618 domain-containing protein [Chloracidobacterium sp.]